MFFDVLVYLYLVFEGMVGDFCVLIIYYLIFDLKVVFDKVNDYLIVGVVVVYVKGKCVLLGSVIGYGLWVFICMYIIQCGFFDGVEGFMFVVLNVEGMYYCYIKLMMLYCYGKC